jgi:prepilin-type N-terminal cleavage/methylation domain-containing protein
MNWERGRGLTLLEVIVVVLVIGILAALIAPLFARRAERAPRTQCASNIRQLLTAMYMYSDSPDSGGYLPTLGSKSDSFDQKQTSSQALHLLYRQYVNDPRIFACPKDPKRPQPARLQELATTQNGRLPAQPMTPADTSYSYDPGHSTNISSMVALIADDRGARENSDNHGPNQGQNVGFGASVEFRESPRNTLGEGQFDPDIFSLNLGSPRLDRNEESFIRP